MVLNESYQALKRSAIYDVVYNDIGFIHNFIATSRKEIISLGQINLNKQLRKKHHHEEKYKV